MPDDLTISDSAPVVEVTTIGAVGVMRFDRPERRNALHHETYGIIRGALDRFADDESIGCVVLTGRGSAFCAGGDVRDGRPRDPAGRPSVELATERLLAEARTTQALAAHPKLTIAAVNGPAVGAGMSFALACDFRIMSSTASLTAGWGKLGFSGDLGGTWFLTQLVGPSRALDIMTSNRKVTPEDALQLGLTNRVAGSDTFDDAWIEWATTLANGPRTAFGFMKQNVVNATTQSLAASLRPETERMVRSGRTADHKEAVRAWLDKREPVFGADLDNI